MKEIVVVGGDWKFRALVRAELRERGYEARGYESLAAAAAEVGPGSSAPAALVVDAADADAGGLAPELAGWAGRCPVVVVLAAGVPFEPPSGSSILRRPVRIEQIVASVAERAGAPA